MTFTYAEGESVVGHMGTYKCPCQQSILGWGVIGGSIPVGVELAGTTLMLVFVQTCSGDVCVVLWQGSVYS